MKFIWCSFLIVSHRFSSFLHGRGFGKFPGGGGILPGLACAACGANCSRTAKSQKLTSTDSIDFHLNHLIPNLFSSKMQEPHCFSNWWFLMLLALFWNTPRCDTAGAGSCDKNGCKSYFTNVARRHYPYTLFWQKRIRLPSGHNWDGLRDYIKSNI